MEVIFQLFLVPIATTGFTAYPMIKYNILSP